MALGFTIGGVSLQDWEVPQDFGPIGGKQVLVKHEFPGGQISQKSLGPFPVPVTWTGYLTGPDAFSRQQQLDAIRVAGLDVTLSYGPYAWLGRVTNFDAKAKHQFLVPYTMTFEPSQDLSGAGGAIGALSADNILLGETTGFNSIVSGISGLALPGSLAVPAAALTSALQTGLMAGDGTVAGIPSASVTSIENAVVGVQTSANTLVAGTDPTLASPAHDLLSWATNIGVTVASPQSPIAQFTAINPNLFQLAVQYFGDQTLWQDIATASGLADPQPPGTHLITIPAS